MNNFFNIDGPFFTFLNRVGDLIILNVVWLICCLPIVTIGASTTALYFSTMKLAAGDEGYVFRNFFKSFRQNFLQSTVIWLIMLVVGVFLGYDLFLIFHVDLHMNSTMQLLVLSLLFMMIMIWLLIFSFIFPLQSKFVNKIKYTFKNSLILSIRHLPWTVGILLSFAAAGFIFYKFSIMFPIFLFIGCAAIAYGQSFIYNKLFSIYINRNKPEEETAEENPDAWTIPEDEEENLKEEEES